MALMMQKWTLLVLASLLLVYIGHSVEGTSDVIPKPDAIPSDPKKEENAPINEEEIEDNDEYADGEMDEMNREDPAELEVQDIEDEKDVADDNDDKDDAIIDADEPKKAKDPFFIWKSRRPRVKVVHIHHHVHNESRRRYVSRRRYTRRRRSSRRRRISRRRGYYRRGYYRRYGK